MWKPNKWMSLCTKSSRILLSEIVKKVWEISFKSIIMDCCTAGRYSIPYIFIKARNETCFVSSEPFLSKLIDYVCIYLTLLKHKCSVVYFRIIRNNLAFSRCIKMFLLLIKIPFSIFSSYDPHLFILCHNMLDQLIHY